MKYMENPLHKNKNTNLNDKDYIFDDFYQELNENNIENNNNCCSNLLYYITCCF
jgi:hypothetical protein